MVGRPRRAYSRHDHPANRKPRRGSYDPIATIAHCLPMFQSSRRTTDSPTFQGCAIMATAAVEEEGEEGGGAPSSRPALAGVTLAGLPMAPGRSGPTRRAVKRPCHAFGDIGTIFRSLNGNCHSFWAE
jgi:hypothetical protein